MKFVRSVLTTVLVSARPLVLWEPDFKAEVFHRSCRDLFDFFSWGRIEQKFWGAKKNIISFNLGWNILLKGRPPNRLLFEPLGAKAPPEARNPATFCGKEIIVAHF